MKIAVVTPSYLPDLRAGGSVSGCSAFVEVLCEKYSVDVISFDTLDDGVNARAFDGYSAIYLPHSRVLDFLSSHGWHLSFHYVLYLIGQGKNYDLFYFRALWNFPSLFGFVFCILTAKPFIFCSSGKLSEHALAISSLKKKIVSFIFHGIIRRAAAVHYSTYDEAAKVSASPYKTITPLVSPTYVRFINRQGAGGGVIDEDSHCCPLKIYTVCRIDPIKNIEYVLAELEGITFDIEFHIVGDGIEEYVSRLKARAREVMAGNSKVKVTWHGFKDRSWVDGVFRGALYVQCSYSEGYSNSVIEALCRGSYAFVSDQINLSELSREGFVTEGSLLRGELRGFLAEYQAHHESYCEKAEHCLSYLKKTRSKAAIARQLDKDLRKIGIVHD